MTRAPLPSLDALTTPVKRAIASQIVGLFNDRSRGEAPVTRSADSLFAEGSVVRRVHGDVTSMLIGGVSGLLLQMLHPAVLAGVWDHSNFRTDMHGRLRRTARFISLTTYGPREEAQQVMDRVRRIHDQVTGVLHDGRPYAASDPALLAWVHVTETTSFLAAYVRYAQPTMSVAEQDRYFAEMAQIAERLGADPVPRTRAEARRMIEAMRPQLLIDDRTREVAHLVLNQRAPSLAVEPFMAMTMKAGVDLLPGWARRMHGFDASVLGRPLLRAGAFGMAQTLRWAFAGSR